MPVAAGERFIDLRDDPPFGVIAVGVDCTHRSDATGGSPCARACVVRCAHALAAFDQRPDLASTIENGLEALEQHTSPWRAGASRATYRSASQLMREKSAPVR